MIETPRLKLIPFTKAQLDAIFANDLETLGKLLDIRPPRAWSTFDGAAEVIPFFYQLVRSLAGDFRFGSYFVVLKKERTLIGTGGYKGMKNIPHSVEIGYEIHPDYQGRGLATEMAQAFVDFARAQGIAQITAHTLREENASVAILKKCGLVFTGEITDPKEGGLWAWATPTPASMKTSSP